MKIWNLLTATAVAATLLSASAPAAEADATDTAEAPAAPEKLTIGSVAPELNIEHWLQREEGEENAVTTFEPGHVYVVEFWATWCGPCLASMPHLAQLQQQYAEKNVRIISVSTEDLETVEPFLEREVPEQILARYGEEEVETESEDAATEDQSDEEERKPVLFGELTKNYSLTADPDQSVSDDYMQAANQNGIPTAFIVSKDGHVEWIGHPMAMDEPLEQIVDGTWDREAFAVEFREQAELQEFQQEIMKLARAAKMEEANELIDNFMANTTNERIKQAAPQLKQFVERSAFATWIARDQPKATEWLQGLAAREDTDAELTEQLVLAVIQSSRRGREISGELLDAASGAVEAADGKHRRDLLKALAQIQQEQEEAAEKAEEEAAEEAGDESDE